MYWSDIISWLESIDWGPLIALDKQLLLWFNGSSSLLLDGVARTFTQAPTWIPLYVALLALVIRNNDSWQRVLLIVACAGACALLAGNVNDMLVKPSVERWRPSRDPEIGILVDVVDGYRSGRWGFFSSHASNTMSIAVFFFILVRSRVLGWTLVVWSLLNCWTRLYLGVHFPGDILCGLIVGTLVGVLVALLHALLSRWLHLSTHFVSSQYTSAGYARSDADLVTVVFLLTCIYALLRATLVLYL